jgi:hypothetical protein
MELNGICSLARWYDGLEINKGDLESNYGVMEQ